jgi:hypothetical protein
MSARRLSGRSSLRGGLLVVSAASIVGLAGSNAKADVYSYVDEQGVLHLTNVPTDARFERYQPTDPAEQEGFGGQRPVVVHVEGERDRSDRRERVLYPVDVSRFDELIREAAAHYRLPFAFIKAVVKVESNFDPRAVSPADAKGLMQLIDGTAASMSVEDPFDPRQSVFGGARYLRILANRFEGDLVLTTAAYNAGPELVARLGRIPRIAETQRYVQRVLKMYRYYRRQSAS